MAEDNRKTVIESGTEFDGTIKSERPVVLSGSLKGQITAPSLDVTLTGKVQGSVKVSQFSCKGEVAGEVLAECVELSGRVCDATVIRAKTLDVKLAQSEGGVEVSFGNCELQVGDLPARPAAKANASTQESSKANAPSGQPAAEASKANPAGGQKVPNDIVDAVSELMK
jgi:cytoskeletal protein CcmA (bactofilin family)